MSKRVHSDQEKSRAIQHPEIDMAETGVETHGMQYIVVGHMILCQWGCWRDPVGIMWRVA